MALTAEQKTLLDAIQRALAADAQIEAAWLAGSLGQGGGDAFSDVDVLALVAQGPATDVGQRYGKSIAAIAEPALVNVLFGGRVINVVTMDWQRFDISFVEAGELVRYDAARLTPLFNRGERAPPFASAVPYRTTPQTLLALVNEFLRVLGLTVAGLGREEYLVSLRGCDLLRGMILDVMLEENGIGPADRGGALHRNNLLTPDQRRELASLSPVVATRAGLIAANGELAAIFLPRARRLAKEIGMAWPSAFEDATRRHLKKNLGLSID